MSGSALKWGALQAVMDAAHDPPGHASTHHAQPRAADPDAADAGSLTEPRYTALLARLLSGEQTQNPHCILFVAACQRTRSTPIALGVTRAAAGLVGRSLLVDGWTALPERHQWAAEFAGDASDAPHRVLPDVFVPRLHHYRVGAGATHADLLFSPSRDAALAALTASFQFVAIDTSPPCWGPAANALARYCSGCVVVVGAGITRQADMQNTLRDLRCAGANIMGTILADAGAYLPGWAGGAAPSRVKPGARVHA